MSEAHAVAATAMDAEPGARGTALAVPREHLPRGEDFLLWPPALQPWGYRIVDRLFATRTVRRGARPRAWLRGPEVNPRYTSPDGQVRDVSAFMDHNNVAGLLVVRHGHIVLERYGLGLRESDRWSTMSTVKSMTATLVGAALHTGALRSLDDGVQQYLPQLADSAYDGVRVRDLLTMSSGAAWSEDYTDRQSHVNRYSKSLADKVPGGVLALMRSLPRAHAPGTVWRYNTGDTYLLGAVLCAATGCSLAAWMEQVVWQPAGMEFDAYYTLESAAGQEIGGSRAGMSLRDIGRFAQCVADDGEVDGHRLLPPGWVQACGQRAFALGPGTDTPSRRALGLTGYGYSWWLRDDGAMLAMGHSGQRIFVDRINGCVVVQLAAYPEPRYCSPGEPDRDAELARFIDAVRGAALQPTG